MFESFSFYPGTQCEMSEEEEAEIRANAVSNYVAIPTRQAYRERQRQELQEQETKAQALRDAVASWRAANRDSDEWIKPPRLDGWWTENDRQEREERDARWAERDRQTREARKARRQAEREAKLEAERLARQQSYYERELAEAAEARRNRPLVDWRAALAEIRRTREAPGPTSKDKKRARIQKMRCDMRLACNCLDAWEFSFPSRPACPLVVDWRERTVSKFNEWSKVEARKNGNVGWSPNSSESPWLDPYSIRYFRRRTLSEYDNQRDGIVRDRYYFGIYAGQYDS